MAFPFNIAKATEVAATFLEKSGGQINVMKLVKLIYLLDRKSFEKRGIPVVGGDYLSMKNGPVTSEVLDLINAGQLTGHENSSWMEHIESRQGHTVRLISPPERCYVSDGELKLIDEIWMQHGHQDQWKLRDWCHENCQEWAPLNAGRSSIMLGAIGSALKKPQEAIDRMREEARTLSQLNSILELTALWWLSDWRSALMQRPTIAA